MGSAASQTGGQETRKRDSHQARRSRWGQSLQRIAIPIHRNTTTDGRGTTLSSPHPSGYTNEG